jgi:AraC-like DNA-binding protein
VFYLKGGKFSCLPPFLFFIVGLVNRWAFCYNFVAIMIKTLWLLLILFNVTFLFSQENKEAKSLDYYKNVTNRPLSYERINKLIIQYKDSLVFFEDDNNLPEIAGYNLSLSKLYSKLGNYNKALEYGKSALRKYQKLKDTTALVYANTSIGIMYGELDDYKIAEEYFRETDKLARLSNNEYQLYHNYINLGIINLDGNVAKALEYFEKAEGYFSKEEGNEITLISIQNNKAVAYKRLGEYDKAIAILKDAFRQIDQTHSYYVSLCSNIATNYLLINQPDSALVYIKYGLNNPAKRIYLNNYVNAYRVLTESYIQKHQPDSSIKYFLLYQQYTDSLFLKKKADNISKLKVIHETDKLISNVKNQKEKIETYNAIFRNLSIGISLLLIAIIVFFIYYKKLQASYRKIVKESVRAMLVEEENTALIKKIKSLEETNEAENIKAPSNFTLEKGDAIFKEIKTLFENEKLFVDPDFNLNKLADRLNSNRTYISNIINSKTGDSFVKFINTYRVNEAKKLLIDNNNKILTLDAIGKLAGFNSPSTFNRVFKMETGVTPSFYIKNKSDH